MADAQLAMDNEAGATWAKDLVPLFEGNPSRQTLNQLRSEVSRASADAEGQIRDVPSSIGIQLMMLKDCTTDSSPTTTAPILLSGDLVKRIRALAAAHQDLEHQAAVLWKEGLMPIFEANPTRETGEQLRAEVTRAAADANGILRDLPANIDVSLKMLRADPRTWASAAGASAPSPRKPRP